MNNIHAVLAALLNKKEVTYQDNRMDDITIKLFAPNELMLTTECGHQVRAEKYMIGQKVGPKAFIPVKMDIGSFLLLPQSMTFDELIKAKEQLENAE